MVKTRRKWVSAHPSSLWVALQWLSGSEEPLMRMAVAESGSELLSGVWTDRDLWQEGLISHSASESHSRLSRSKLLIRTAEYTFRKWVAVQFLSRSEPLTRMAEQWTYIQQVSCSLFEEIWVRATDENGWTPIQQVSCHDDLWRDQNHWKELLHQQKG